ncbi:hypothetical protein F5X96DRAFT_633931 [Biscogniauxia mediterranea]|nr:hypothetical protein F5X96DRAFT_633931 [Biscogniauxia mediterranea]
MDDQFNGRTDDDLFADDFEPVGQEEQVVEVTPVPEPVVADTQPQPQPQSQLVAHSAPEAPEAAKPAESTQPAAASIPTSTASPAASATPPPLSAPKTLSQSRHAKGAHQSRPRKHSPKQAPPTAAPESSQPSTSTATESSHGTGTATATTPTPSSTTNNTATSATSSSPIRPGSNTALADRLASGANPRTKLTDSELAAKMERMRILAAEKTRKFEQAEQDSRSHALAYERGMEEARRRRAEEAERRRKGEEERRRMDEERAANRERKLKAMGAREDGWDEGKNMDEEPRRFRGANGGVRGSRHAATGPGIAGSRFATPDRDDAPVREFSADEFRGRGRGRGRGSSRGGRGGRGGGGSSNFHDGDRNSTRAGGPLATTQNGTSKPKEAQVVPTAEDFPALPSSGLEKLDTSRKPNDAAKPAPLPVALQSPLTGKWDDEMEELDASANNGA